MREGGGGEGGTFLTLWLGGVGTCSGEGAYQRLGAYSRKYASSCYGNIIFLTLKFCKKKLDLYFPLS